MDWRGGFAGDGIGHLVHRHNRASWNKGRVIGFAAFGMASQYEENRIMNRRIYASRWTPLKRPLPGCWQDNQIVAFCQAIYQEELLNK
jgi:hypothetical protein